MKRITTLFLVSLVFLVANISLAQESKVIEKHINRLEIKKGKKKVFRNSRRDSVLHLSIDTLILNDHASLQFFALKDVKLTVKNAVIGDKAYFSGVGAKNNGTNFDITIGIEKVGSLYVIARGIDAMNGTRTFPNGDGGDVKFTYTSPGFEIQSQDKSAPNYVYIDASPGGRTVNPQTDLAVIMNRIGNNYPRMGGMPQGQVYSGSRGREGEVVIEKN